MSRIDEIRRAYFEEGKTISGISAEYALDRKTVRKYVMKEDFNAVVPSVDREAMQPKLDPYKKTIDEWLEGDMKARRKQRHTAKRVYDRLVETHAGFDCSYRTVAAYVGSRRKSLYATDRAALPLVHKAGEAQADFGSADFYLNGKLYDGNYLNVSFPYSNAGYLQLFKGENAECLFEGLTTIFVRLGGIPPRIWFDNASTLVAAVLKGGARDLTQGFLRFKEHHGFIAAFCNPNAGHEKGNVENKVGYHRRNLLVPGPEFGDLDAYNRTLLDRSVEDHGREHYRFDGSIAQRHEDQIALGALGCLADRLRHFTRLAVAEADAALLVADDDERGEAEALAALHHLGDAVDVDQLVHERIVAILAFTLTFTSHDLILVFPRSTRS